MQKYIFIIVAILISISPPAIFAEEGFLGENPGFDFYSKIDQGSYRVLEKTVTRRLEETPKMNEFARGCVNAELLKNLNTSTKLLEEIQNGDYTDFYASLTKNTQRRTITSDSFLDITRCITGKYQKVREEANRENNARTTISYIGLYMDGDKTNSDYDILTDIEKINTVIFSQDLKYGGTVNASGKGLADFLANKPIASLFAPQVAVTVPLVASPSNPAGTPSRPQAVGDPQNIAALLGTTCSTTNPTGPVDTVQDEAFLAELAGVLESGRTDIGVTSGYTPSTGTNQNTSATTPSNLTSAGDFFHTLPCTSIFCIKVSLSPSQGSLVGGKNISIEGILEKHSKIIYPISESSLDCQRMTNNAASSPKKGLNLFKIFSGGKIYLMGKSQITRRDKREDTPDRKAEELKGIKNCAYVSAGLSTDPARSRSMAGAGYSGIQGADTETASNTKKPLGPQEASNLVAYTACLDTYMQAGRKSYYDSFSTDVTEIQAYTASMMSTISNIIAVLSAMDTKPRECPKS